MGIEPAQQQALLSRDVLSLARVVRDTHLTGLVGGDLENEGLDEHLLAGRIQLFDHAAQSLEILERRHDQQRVGGRVEGDAHIALEHERALIALLVLRGSSGRRRGGASPAPHPGGQ